MVHGFLKLNLSCSYWILFQTPGGVRADPELLPHGQAALPHRRVRPAVRGGARVLGPRQQPGGANK